MFAQITTAALLLLLAAPALANGKPYEPPVTDYPSDTHGSGTRANEKEDREGVLYCRPTDGDGDGEQDEEICTWYPGEPQPGQGVGR